MAVALPDRYRTPWRPMLLDEVGDRLVEGVRILDVGSGRTPAIRIEDRPIDCHYVGLDIDRSELDRAPLGGYTETYTADATQVVPELVGQFDIVLSWQLLEHVRSTRAVTDAMHAYLRPGGTMFSVLSGRNSVFALPNRVIPHSLAKKVLSHLLHRDPETVFPAIYDSCSYSRLRDVMGRWSQADITCYYRGAHYLKFSSALQWLYLKVEDQFASRNARQLATHYLIVASK